MRLPEIVLRTRNKSRGLALALAVALVAAWAGFHLLDGSAASRVPGASSARPAIPLDRSSPETRSLRTGSHLTQPPGGEDLTFERLMALLAPEASSPAAVQFVEEFMKEPALKKAYDKLKQDQAAFKGKRPVKPFVAWLGTNDGFRRLVARFKTNPEFLRVGTALSQQPELKRLMPLLLAGAREKGAGTRQAPAGRLLDLERTSPRAAFATDLAAGPRAGGRRRGAASGNASVSGTHPLEEVPDATPPALGPGEESHEVDPGLPPAADVSQPPTRRFCALYPQFCFGEPPQVRPEFQALANTGLIETYGLWGACFRLNIWKLCRNACVGSCAPRSGWASCLDAWSGDEPKCIQECRNQPPCAVPGGALGRYCTVRSPAVPPAYCGSEGRVLPPVTDGAPAGAPPPDSEIWCIRRGQSRCCYKAGTTDLDDSSDGDLTLCPR